LANAQTWLTRAAEAGHIMAQFNLGFLLEQELNPPDLPRARMWYTRAAEAGHSGAREALEQRFLPNDQGEP
jgi:TPR repeat protein